MTKALVVFAIIVSIATVATSSMILQARVAPSMTGGAPATALPAPSSASPNLPQQSQGTTSVQTTMTSAGTATLPSLVGQPGPGQSLSSCLPIAFADQPIAQQLGSYKTSGYCETIRGVTPLGK